QRSPHRGVVVGGDEGIEEDAITVAGRVEGVLVVLRVKSDEFLLAVLPAHGPVVHIALDQGVLGGVGPHGQDLDNLHAVDVLAPVVLPGAQRNLLGGEGIQHEGAGPDGLLIGVRRGILVLPDVLGDDLTGREGYQVGEGGLVVGDGDVCVVARLNLYEGVRRVG